MQKGRIRVEILLHGSKRAVEQMREAPLTHEIVSIGLGLPLPLGPGGPLPGRSSRMERGSSSAPERQLFAQSRAPLEHVVFSC